MRTGLNFKTKWSNHAEWARYNKRNKKAKKEMRKIIKRYGPFDYGFILEIMDVMFKHMGEYYEKKDWVFSYYPDTEAWNKVPQRDEIAKELSRLLDAYYDADYKDELNAWNEFFDYMKKYLYYLWD